MPAIFRVRYLLVLRLCVFVSRMQQLHCRREVQKQNEKSANAYTHEILHHTPLHVLKELRPRIYQRSSNARCLGYLVPRSHHHRGG